MKKSVLLILSMICFLPVLALTQEVHSGSVDGRIRVGSGYAGAVQIQLQHIGVTVQEQFSADGRFQFRDVPIGRYTLIIRAPGLDSESREISIPDSNLLIEVGIKARPPASPTTSVLDAQIPRTARLEYERGRDRMRHGDCAMALKHLAQAIRLFANYTDAHNAAGNCHVQLQQPALAEEAFRKAIALAASVFPAINLADVYITQGRLNEANDVLTRAVRRDPTQGDGYYALARLRFEENRLDEARELGRKAHDRRQHIADVHLLMAKIHQRQGNDGLISRELQRYVDESRPGPIRDLIRKMLADETSLQD